MTTHGKRTHDIDSKTAVVTGATSGLGRAAARAQAPAFAAALRSTLEHPWAPKALAPASAERMAS